jgi:hypothetical protein
MLRINWIYLPGRVINTITKKTPTKEDKTMTKEMPNRAKELRVPQTSTSENLECQGFKVLTFGNKILAVGYYYMGRNKASYYGAAYTFTTDDHTCEGNIKLEALSENFFEDDGHAFAWAMNA